MFSENLRESLDLTLFWEYRVVLLKGLEFNAYVFAGAALAGLVLGLAACLARLSPRRVLATLGGGYAELFRNAPEYVLLIWIHYVPPLVLTHLIGVKVSFPPVLSAIVALGLAYSGYFTETFRAGILSVPRGHIEAAETLGLRRASVLGRIVLPQAVRQMLPELLNQLVSLFKATTLVSLIAVPDLMYNVSMITSQEMRPLPLYTGAALVYCAIIFVAATSVRVFGDRWRRRSV